MSAYNNKFVVPVIDSLKNLFNKTLSLEVNERLPYIMTNDDATASSFDIISIIGLSGEVRGSVILGFKREVAMKVSSKYWQKEMVEFDEDVFDTVGELVNIIAGNAKQGIESYRIYISLPTVFQGSEIKATTLSRTNKDIPTIMIPFTSDVGDMHVILSYKFET